MPEMLEQPPNDAIPCFTPGHEHIQVGTYEDGTVLMRCENTNFVWTEEE